MRVPVALHLCQHLVLSVFILVVLRGVKWYLIVVLICIFLMTTVVEHLFMCLFAIFMSHLLMYLFKSLPFCHWVVYLLPHDFQEFFIYSRQSSIGYVVYKYFLLIYSLLFLSLNSVFYRANFVLIVIKICVM